MSIGGNPRGCVIGASMAARATAISSLRARDQALISRYRRMRRLACAGFREMDSIRCAQAGRLTGEVRTGGAVAVILVDETLQISTWMTSLRRRRSRTISLIMARSVESRLLCMGRQADPDQGDPGIGKGLRDDIDALTVFRAPGIGERCGARAGRP